MSDARTREAVLPILQSMLVKGGIIQNLLSTYSRKAQIVRVHLKKLMTVKHYELY